MNKERGLMSLNQYNVKAHVKGFNQLKVPQTILDCEFNLDFDKQQYFISTIVFAKAGKKHKKRVWRESILLLECSKFI